MPRFLGRRPPVLFPMRAAVLTEPKKITWVDRDSPPLSRGEVRVQVRRAGICGTDLAIWRGDYRVPLPIVLGHEWAGEVIETCGKEADPWKGLLVTAEINQSCAALGLPDLCPECEAGRPTHCQRRRVTGIAGADGAFQQEIVLPAAVLHSLPSEWPEAWGVFIEPLAAALQTFELSPIAPRDLVVILGPGRLGILAGLVARALGTRILMAGRSPSGLALAAALGLETLVWDLSQRVEPEDPLAPAPSPLLDWVMEKSKGTGADIVVEATGSSQGLPAALDLVRPRGTVALKSTPGTPVLSLNVTRAVVREVRLQGSRCGDFAQAICFQQQHNLPLERLIARRFPFDQLPEALAAATQGGKTLLDFV